MIKDYFKIAFRNVFKRKAYSLLNIAGLTIGMSCCLLIFHYVSYEKSYDSFEPNADQVVRVRLDSYQQGKLAFQSATSYQAIAPAMKRDFAEVENYCRLIDNELLLANDEADKKFSETKGYYADAAATNIFGLQFLEGNPATALDAPYKIILSATTAKKYFGNGKALGKLLSVRNKGIPQTLQVSGVYKDFPGNSHLVMQYLVSYTTLGKEMVLSGDNSNSSETAWGWYDFYVYLQLKPGVNWKQLEAKMPAFTDKYINNENKNSGRRAELHLIPLSDIHLYSNYNQEAEVNGNGQAITFLFLIAILIVVIAWINYINLATARSVERAREVGVRKVLGALRAGLIKQFLIESLVLNMLSLVMSLLLFFIFLSLFDAFTGREGFTGITLTSAYWYLFLGLFVCGTLLSGIYPALVLSAFKPVVVLKGAFKNSSRGVLLRKGLIIGQFAASIILIAGTLVVYRQVNYMRNQSLGANIDQTLILSGPHSLTDSLYRDAYQPFKTAVLQQTSIKNISTSSNVPGDEIYWTRSFKSLSAETQDFVTLYNLGIDYDFIPSYNIKMAAGRNFSADFGTDKQAVIINETAASLLGFTKAGDAIGKIITRGGSDSLKIVGVTANFHQLGLQKNIDPMVMLLNRNTSQFFSIKVQADRTHETISKLQALWLTYFPKDPFEYKFLDQSFGQQYQADMLFGKVFGMFAGLAIIIACFGLLGLSAYNVLQRTKEISIRKVLGASVEGLLLMLSKDFIKLIIIAFVIAIPAGWYVMHQWLQGYAYRISLTWNVFAVAGAAVLLIALVTICWQAIRAAIANPVKSLRSE